MIQANVIHEALATDASKLLLLGSSCIYPKLAPQPMRDDAPVGGPSETTNETYVIAKISGIVPSASYSRQYGE